jgi:hypothetical protein
VVIFTPLSLFLGETAPGIHCTRIGGWVGPIAGLDLAEKRKITFPYQESNTESDAKGKGILIIVKLLWIIMIHILLTGRKK